MPLDYTQDYLLDKKIKIYQPINGYRASSDAVLLAAFVRGLKNGSRVLDVGSGTGAISLCLAHRFAEYNPQIIGIDVQKELVDLANLSAKDNNFSSVCFYHQDIRDNFHNENLPFCSFDAVVTNPPYSDHDMPSPNPAKATAHNHSNFNLTQWLKFCLKMLKPFGKIYMVNRVECLPETCQSFCGAAGNITIMPIYSKEGQQAKRVLICAQKDSKTPCRILPSLTTHQTSGEYTDECTKILRQGLGFSELFNY